MNEPVFLRLNGVTVPRATDELYAAMIAIVEWGMGKPELAALALAVGPGCLIEGGVGRSPRPACVGARLLSKLVHWLHRVPWSPAGRLTNNGQTPLEIAPWGFVTKR